MAPRTEPEPADHDERLGEAIETYLALAESGPPPEPEAFAGGYPGLESDLVAALEGLALVQGLVGEPGAAGPGPRLETGRRIAGYRIVRELGRGGMGVVYEAVHVGLDRPVALKVLGGHAAPDSGGRRRFLNEARTAAGLHHTHIVPVFDVGQVGGLCYYAMQRIEGSGLDRVVRHLRRDRVTAAGSSSGPVTPLRSRLGLRPATPAPPRGSASATGPWPVADAPDPGGYALTGTGGLPGAAREPDDDEPPPFVPPRGSAYYRWVAGVGREAAEALGYAHRRGVIHRDVKPSNLLVDGRGLVWVADFGLARRLADPSMTHHDSLLGTPRYMSPEQTRVGPVDGRTDLYSLGATLYELLTLRPPFEGRSAAELVGQIARDEPTPPRQIDPRVPRDLETICLKLLAKRPADRYAAAAELADDLARFLSHEPVRARRISPAGRAWRFARRHPGATAVSAAAAAALLAVTTVAYVKVLHERDQAIRAVRTQLWREASVVRLSNVPNRRAAGLGLIKESAALGPEPALKTKLRDEAVEFLGMRDVEARPGFPTGRVRGLVFGPFGDRLATLGPSPRGGESVRVWDVGRRAPLSEQPLRPGPPAAEPSPGRPAPPVPPAPGPQRGRGRGPNWPQLAVAGRFLAVVAADGPGPGPGPGPATGVRLLDAADGSPVRTLGMPGRRVRGLFATPDGRRVVTVEGVSGPGAGGPSARPAPGRRPSQAFAVNLWDAGRDDAPARTLTRSDPDEAGTTHPLVAVSPDGKTVATAWSHRTAVSLWSAETGEAAGAIDTQAELTALALGPDNLLATAGGGEVRLWDTATRTPLPSLAPGQSEVRLLRFSPRGPLLAVGGPVGRGLELWDTSAHAVVAVLPTADPVEDVAFSPDGLTLAAATTGETTQVWAVVESGARVRIAGFDAPTRALAFRGDGLLALGVWKGDVRFRDGGRSLQTGPSAAAADDPSRGRDHDRDRDRDRDAPAARDRPAQFAFDDRGDLLTLDADGLCVWAAPPRSPDGPVRVPLPHAPGFFRAGPVLAASPDGRAAAVVRGDQVFLWRSAAPATAVAVKPPPELAGRVRDFARDRDRDRDRGFNRDRGPDFNRGRFVPPLNWRAVVVAPGADRLYLLEFGSTDGGGAAHAWALDGARARSLAWPALPADATSLALSPDGRVLAVGDHAGAVTLIDTSRGAARARLSPDPAVGGVEGQVSSLAFSADGRDLAVGTRQGAIALWSPSDPSGPVFRLPGHREAVTSLAFDAHGSHLASSGADKTVDVWDLDLIRRAFARLGLGW